MLKFEMMEIGREGKGVKWSAWNSFINYVVNGLKLCFKQKSVSVKWNWLIVLEAMSSPVISKKSKNPKILLEIRKRNINKNEEIKYKEFRLYIRMMKRELLLKADDINERWKRHIKRFSYFSSWPDFQVRYGEIMLIFS